MRTNEALIDRVSELTDRPEHSRARARIERAINSDIGGALD